jgi:trigger factor
VKVTTEELERCETLLTLEIDPNQQEKLLKKAAQRISREARIPGFRPGKAPYNVIVRRFGLEALQSEALEASVEELVKKGIAEADITPYAQIKLDGVAWNPLTIKIRVPTKPQVELGDYRATRLEATPVEVSNEDVDQALARLQEQRATWVPVERAAELGDLISMTVTETEGDTTLTDHQAVEYELKAVPEEQQDKQPDLTTPLLGLNAGESKTFTINYPAEFDNEEYAGKEITFSVEVSGVKQKELDPLDDEFAKQIGDYETLKALNDKIREDIRQSRQRQNDMELGLKALDEIIEKAEKIEWPVGMEEEQIDAEIDQMEHHLKQSGLTLDSYLRVNNKSKEALREEMRERVISQLRRGLVMSKVAELEKLEVSQLEILEQAKIMADMFGGGDRVWQNIMASEARQSVLANDLLSNKVVHRLAAIAKGEAPEPAIAENNAAETSPPTADSEADSALTTETVDSSTEESVTSQA